MKCRVRELRQDATGCDTKEGISCCRWTERLDGKWDRAVDRRTPRRAGTSSSHRLLAHHFPGRPPDLPALDAQLLRAASRAHPALYEPPLRWQAPRANRPGRTARYSFRQCTPRRAYAVQRARPGKAAGCRLRSGRCGTPGQGRHVAKTTPCQPGLQSQYCCL